MKNQYCGSTCLYSSHGMCRSSLQIAGFIRRTPSVCLRQPPPPMVEAWKAARFSPSVPAERALHGSRKACASCPRKTGRRGSTPTYCGNALISSLPPGGRGTAPAVEGACATQKLHSADCKGNRRIWCGDHRRGLLRKKSNIQAPQAPSPGFAVGTKNVSSPLRSNEITTALSFRQRDGSEEPNGSHLAPSSPEGALKIRFVLHIHYRQVPRFRIHHRWASHYVSKPSSGRKVAREA